jgi:Zn-dependent protease with chaperone function
LNISYMSLSREMEFHADEVAANVVGSEPLIASLLRMDLADHSYNEVLQYYHTRISDGIKPYNIYPDQTNVINFLATKSKIPLAENLPQVTLSHLSRYNKSKLVVVDQWASHPSTEDRVLRLEKLNRSSESFNQSPASTVFSDINALHSV